MKKYNTLLTLSLIFSSMVNAQKEPEAINTKDLIDKIDRSEITTEDSNPTLENIMPEFEIPKIEYKEKETKNSKAQKSSNPVKNKPVVKSNTKPTNKVVIAKRPISLVQLFKNDKIVIRNGKTYVYRLSKKIITQYTMKDQIPLNSSGLKPSGKNSYYVINTGMLKNDAKAAKTKKPKQQQESVKVIPVKKNVNNSNVKPNKNKTLSPEILAKRKDLENKFNRGKVIESTIRLRALQTNDEILISGGVQMVIRKKKNTSGTKKYWLIEKFDINNKAVIEKSKNVYKLRQSYQ